MSDELGRPEEAIGYLVDCYWLEGWYSAMLNHSEHANIRVLARKSRQELTDRIHALEAEIARLKEGRENER